MKLRLFTRLDSFGRDCEIHRSHHIRLIGYICIFVSYILFMERFAPNGISWASYHSQSIFNAVEYLKLHGYFENFGFSIWTSCDDCILTNKESQKIYLSFSSITFIPFIFLNELGGKPLLILVGPYIDKIIIFFTATLLTENFSRSFKSSHFISQLFFDFIFFLLFISSVWVYLMIRAAWQEIWFMLFFVSYLLFSQLRLYRLGFACFIISCLAHPMWGLLIAVVSFSLLTLAKFFSETEKMKSFFIQGTIYKKHIYSIFLSAVFINFFNFLLRNMVIDKNPGKTDGSSLIWRIGVSGDDIHNGGILGALQFLGGVRLTKCFGDLSFFTTLGLVDKIAAFNCSLSVLGMTILSAISVFGVVWAMVYCWRMRFLIFPISISLLVVLSILQQSNSVHLLGYSYVFSMVFAVGLTYLLRIFAEKLQSKTLSIIIISPMVTAIVLLSIRVSMLD
jgi:hypothetical protein